MLRRYPIGSIEFSPLIFGDAIEEFSQPLPRDCERGQAIHFCNAYSVALAHANSNYRALLDQGDIICCDGVPVTWFARLFHQDADASWDRIYGPDVMGAVFAQGGVHGAKHFFLGGSESTLAKLVSRVRAQWPEVEIAGHESPPFRELTAAEVDEQVARIRDSGATHIWVGLGQPKQDFATAYLAQNLFAKVFAVGAAFDFLACVKPQAPVWARRSGTEWLFRLASEPRRLSRRYFWGNPIFVYSAVKERIVNRT
jgi:N-acetylglucosaminyldiphosphoundecaprenol N-acetyl-beta-D-mannosaminyltransferase